VQLEQLGDVGLGGLEHLDLADHDVLQRVDALRRNRRRQRWGYDVIGGRATSESVGRLSKSRRGKGAGGEEGEERWW
jgi:hypothetical protein